MNFELSCAVANIDFTTKKTHQYQGIKMHMMTHFPSANFFWGAPSYLTDMELPELSHLRTKGMLIIDLNRNLNYDQKHNQKHIKPHLECH